jgi:hypothetical protein
MLSDAFLITGAAEQIERQERIRRERQEIRNESSQAPAVSHALASLPPVFGPEDRAYFESLADPFAGESAWPAGENRPAEVFEHALVGELNGAGAPAPPVNVPPPGRTPEWVAERLAEEHRMDAERAEAVRSEIANEKLDELGASVTLTPEPVTLWLLASGLISLSIASMFRRRRF